MDSRKPELQRHAAGQLVGAKPGPGGSLVRGAAEFPDASQEPKATGGRKAQWGRSPLSPAIRYRRQGRATGFASAETGA